MKGTSGLFNLGATCYLNAVSQCVARSKHLYEVASQSENIPFEKEWKDLLTSLENPGTIRPVRYIQYVRNSARSAGFPELSRGGQNDAHEMFLYWIDQHKSCQSVVEWKLKTSVKCSCGHKTIKLEQSPCLELDVQGATLKECISNYFVPEQLADYSCDECKQKGGIVRQTLLNESPKTIVLSLKKYHQNGKKILIKFPMEFTMNGKDYILMGVVNHYGNLGGGHYTAYARNSLAEPWMHYNDTSVSPINGESVVSANAYMLFYDQT